MRGVPENAIISVSHSMTKVIQFFLTLDSNSFFFFFFFPQQLFIITMHLGRPGSTDDVMVSVLASSAVDRGFEPQSCQTKYYKIEKKKNNTG